MHAAPLAAPEIALAMQDGSVKVHKPDDGAAVRTLTLPAGPPPASAPPASPHPHLRPCDSHAPHRALRIGTALHVFEGEATTAARSLTLDTPAVCLVRLRNGEAVSVHEDGSAVRWELASGAKETRARRGPRARRQARR